MSIEIINNTLQIQFSRPWDLEKYELFLRCKKLPEYNLDYHWQTDSYLLKTHARFAKIIDAAIEIPRGKGLPLSDHLFDYQKHFTQAALDAERYACWADTGLGKTQIGLEFDRQVVAITGGRVLIIAPLSIIPQWCDEARQWFNFELEVIASREGLRQWCAGPEDGRTGIVNPEKFIPERGEDQKVSECNRLAGVILDEASILRSGGGVIKWVLIHSFKGVQYKLNLTATPAPNEAMEYASQASFLEKLRSEGDILWTYFIRAKDGSWKVKEHARDAFYQFMSSWSVYLRNPARYGFADNLKDLPPPEIFEHYIEPTAEQLELAIQTPTANGQLALWRPEKLGMVQRTQLSEMAKGFIYGDQGKTRRIASNKPDFVADVIAGDHRAGHQVLVWTLFDEESEILSEKLYGQVKGFEVLTGKVKMADRQPIIERFRKGETPVLITRAKMLGRGLNLQNCTSMVFSGFSDSFEDLYQATRRAYRYGQTKRVRVHIPVIRELEGAIWQNLQEKQAGFERDAAIMEQCYVKAMREVVA